MIFMVLALGISLGAGAQNRPGKKRANGKAVRRQGTKAKKPEKAEPAKTLKPAVLKADSQKIAAPLQPVLPDSVPGDTSRSAAENDKSDLEDEVKYTAEDSVIYDEAASKV